MQMFIVALLLCLIAEVVSANGPPPMSPIPPGPKLLIPSDLPPLISLRDAFSRALLEHSKLKIAKNQLERRHAETIGRVAALLPKIRLVAAYTKNIPHVKKSMGRGPDTSLYGYVAQLLRQQGDLAGAAQMEQKRDATVRRDPSGKIVILPNHLFESKLTLEAPIFNGPDIARLMASTEAASLQDCKVREEEANTIYGTAKTYFQAVHLKNVLGLREQALTVGKERLVHASSEKKRGRVIKRDTDEASANYALKEAERDGALLEYRAAIGELGIMLGLKEEFAVEDPGNLMFDTLKGDADKLISIAMVSRPDLKAEERALRIAESERLAHFLQFLPTVTFQVDAKYTSNDKSLLGENFTYAIGLNAVLSVFDGGASIAALRETSLRKKESEIKIRELKIEIDSKIRGRKQRIAQLEKSQQAYEMKALAAKESADVALSLYKRGRTKHQELLDMNDRKLDIDIALRKVQYDLNLERLALVYEAGMLTPQFVF